MQDWQAQYVSTLAAGARSATRCVRRLRSVRRRRWLDIRLYLEFPARASSRELKTVKWSSVSCFPFCRRFPNQFARWQAMPGVWGYFEHRQDKQQLLVGAPQVRSSIEIRRSAPLAGFSDFIVGVREVTGEGHHSLLGCNQCVPSVLSVFVWSVRITDGLVAGSSNLCARFPSLAMLDA